MSEQIFESMNKHLSFLKDESRLKGHARGIIFPRNEADVLKGLGSLNGLPLTIQGGLTGLSGGAVPLGGYVMNLSRMNKVKEFFYNPKLESWCVRLQSGVLLRDLMILLNGKKKDPSIPGYENYRAGESWFFPPDPTELTASLGGMAACNASGARGYYYGAMRSYVLGMKVVLPDGSLLELEREKDKLSGFALPPAKGPRGILREIRLPEVKNCAGYYIRENMDYLDLFIGAEGGLGIITELTLRLVKEPKNRWGIIFFLPREEIALNLKEDLGSCKFLVALEYFDENALILLRELKKQASFASLPVIKEDVCCALYLELHGEEEELGVQVQDIIEFLETRGGDVDNSWIADNPRELKAQKFFRHALPEGVNLKIDAIRKNYPEITKLGTDMAVPREALFQIMKTYRRGLIEKNLDFVIFGHLGENHLHVNIIPRNPEEYKLGLELYYLWAKEVLASGGTVAAEHGTGKIKNSLLALMFKELGDLKHVKTLFDPRGILNPGNWFDSIPKIK